MSSKRCFRCSQVKPLEAFYKHARMGDGRLNKCIECTKADVREHRLRNIERVRAYDRSRGKSPDRVAARKAYATTLEAKLASARSKRKWAVINAYKIKANTAVSNAVRDGRIARQPCFICGDENAQAHHPDYAAPLAVTWLCSPHHSQLHAEHREYLREAA